MSVLEKPQQYFGKSTWTDFGKDQRKIVGKLSNSFEYVEKDPVDLGKFYKRKEEYVDILEKILA